MNASNHAKRKTLNFAESIYPHPMIRTLLKLGFFVVIGLVGYNYFFGTEAEKEQSKALVGKATDLGRDAWNLLRSERDKMEQGKYDEALDRLDGLYTSLRTTARDLEDSQALDRLSELAKRRQELEEVIEGGYELTQYDRRKLEDLTADTEELMNEMEAENRSPAPY